MNKLLKISATLALAVGAASSSYAAVVLPTNGNSQLTLSILDTTNSNSLVVGLNVDFLTLVNNGQSEAGYSITNAISAGDVGAVASFLGTASSATRWWVVGADALLDVDAFPNLGTQVLTTAPTNVSTISTTNAGTRQAADAVGTFYTRLNNHDDGNDDNLFYAASGQLAYAGHTNWGARVGGNLPPNIAGGAVGSALNFWLFSAASDLNSLQATKDLFDNSGGVGQWLLTGEGVLSYNLAAAVPLPAAVWLLLSGIGGLGVFGRRRAATAA